MNGCLSRQARIEIGMTDASARPVNRREVEWLVTWPLTEHAVVAVRAAVVVAVLAAVVVAAVVVHTGAVSVWVGGLAR